MSNHRRRRFSSGEAFVVYHAAGGICSICHLPVDERNFEVDHGLAFANGGETKINNGHLAHPKCNREKGVKMLLEYKLAIRKLHWRLGVGRETVSTWVTSREENFLLFATPGSGKTVAAGRTIHHELIEGLATFGVYIVPTDALRGQTRTLWPRNGIAIQKRLRKQQSDGGI